MNQNTSPAKLVLLTPRLHCLPWARGEGGLRGQEAQRERKEQTIRAALGDLGIVSKSKG